MIARRPFKGRRFCASAAPRPVPPSSATPSRKGVRWSRDGTPRCALVSHPSDSPASSAFGGHQNSHKGLRAERETTLRQSARGLTRRPACAKVRRVYRGAAVGGRRSCGYRGGRHCFARRLALRLCRRLYPVCPRRGDSRIARTIASAPLHLCTHASAYRPPVGADSISALDDIPAAPPLSPLERIHAPPPLYAFA